MPISAVKSVHVHHVTILIGKTARQMSASYMVHVHHVTILVEKMVRCMHGSHMTSLADLDNAIIIHTPILSINFKSLWKQERLTLDNTQ